MRPDGAADQRLEQLGRARVEARARLVQQQQRRVVQHGARPTASRCTIPRERSRTGSSRAALHADRGEQLVHALVAGTPCRPRVVAQVLAPVSVAVEQRLVAEVARPAAAHLPALLAGARAPSTRH